MRSATSRRPTSGQNPSFGRCIQGGIAYAFSKRRNAPGLSKKWQSDRYVNFIKESNQQALMPSSIEMRADVERNFIRTQLHQFGPHHGRMDPYFEKFFWFNRHYDLRWNPDTQCGRLLSCIGTCHGRRALHGDLDTRRKKGQPLDQFQAAGAGSSSIKGITLTYRLPLDKLPLTD